MSWGASVIQESPALSALRNELRGKRWTLVEGEGPIIAVALHDGHKLRDDVQRHIILSDKQRLREEDPHTGRWAALAPTHLIAHYSRFEIDQNRPREHAIYRTPRESWGLQVWRELPDDVAERSILCYNAFYLEFTELLQRKLQQHPYLFVYDIHTYNYRRQGPNAPFDPDEKNPEINIGTAITGMDHRFDPIHRYIRNQLRQFDYFGRHLDVRDNVRFNGGYLPFWIHTHFPQRVCSIQFEVRKFFMDEWTGEADDAQIAKIGEAFASTFPGVLEELRKLS